MGIYQSDFRNFFGLGTAKSKVGAIVFYALAFILFSVMYSRLMRLETGITVLGFHGLFAVFLGGYAWLIVKKRELNDYAFLIFITVILTLVGAYVLGLIPIAYLMTRQGRSETSLPSTPSIPQGASSQSVALPEATTSAKSRFTILRVLWMILLIPVTLSTILLVFGIPGSDMSFIYALLFFSWGMAPLSFLIASVGSWILLLGKPSAMRTQFANNLVYLPFLNILIFLISGILFASFCGGQFDCRV